MLFDFYHEVMNIHKLSPDGQCLKGLLGENLLESMVVLDQLSKCTLSR